MMNISLAGRAAVICGGSRGIGRSIALAFAEAGADVSICARGQQSLDATAADLARFGHKVHAASCDLADGPAVVDYVNAAAAALGGIDVLVNNASGFGVTDDEPGWAASLDVDLMATVRASNTALPFLSRRGGSIVNISSISGMVPAVRTPPYGAVKAALFQYTKTQAAAWAGKRIRSNCIAPGSIEFPGGTWEKRKTENPKLYNAIFDSIPFGRLGTPEEVANLALFLASDAASWITAQTIAIDGGQLLS